MDYVRIMGVESLSARARYGAGVRIGILDSGCPKPSCLPNSHVAGYGDNMADEFGHATAIASLLFGGGGIVGVCGLAEPLYFKVLDDSGYASAKTVANGIYDAIEHNVDIINMSLGFNRTEKCPKYLKMACEAACKAGKVIFCAAGNDGKAVNWPGALETTICVGSTDRNGLKSPFSSIGEVDFVAPGQDLRVLDPKGHIKTVSGTSFSTALVSGVAALLVYEMKRDNLPVDIDSVRTALKNISKDIDSPGYDRNTGYGLVFGGNSDPTVGMMQKQGFFDKILSAIKAIIGLGREKHKGAE